MQTVRCYGGQGMPSGDVGLPGSSGRGSDDLPLPSRHESAPTRTHGGIARTRPGRPPYADSIARHAPPFVTQALVRWSAFCCATGRPMRINQGTRDYFAIADRDDLSYEEKLVEYRKLADDYFQVPAYQEFCATELAHLDEVLVEWVECPDFDELLVDTVTSTFPAHEQERFVGHYRGLLAAWAGDQRAAA